MSRPACGKNPIKSDELSLFYDFCELIEYVELLIDSLLFNNFSSSPCYSDFIDINSIKSIIIQYITI